MLPEGILEIGNREDQDIESKKPKFNILLLGYGYPDNALELREKACKALRARGYQIRIMREFKTKSKEKLNDKFRRILKEFSPKLFLILISQELGATGASYEVSLLVEKHGVKIASKMIRICVGEDLDLGISFNEYVTELDEVVVRKYKDDDFKNMLMVMENTIIDAMT